jgi:hypothetical protein
VTRSTLLKVDAGRAQECELFKKESKLKTYLKKKRLTLVGGLQNLEVFWF